ncbi:Protein pelota [Hordeum vulgare]|nr:Protein pelota [Hordeum vulgare]
MATRDSVATVASVVDLAWSGLVGDCLRSHNRERRASPFADQLQRGVFVFYHRHSFKEVLDTPGVMSLIKDTKAAQEVQALKEFFAMLTNDSTRACYGPKHVEVAHERLAIQALLMTDTLFRNTDIASSHQPLIVPN